MTHAKEQIILARKMLNRALMALGAEGATFELQQQQAVMQCDFAIDAIRKAMRGLVPSSRVAPGEPDPRD